MDADEKIVVSFGLFKGDVARRECERNTILPCACTAAVMTFFFLFCGMGIIIVDYSYGTVLIRFID